MTACGDGDESGPCLLFDASNWDQPQNVTVRAYGSGQVIHTLASSDAGYNGLNVGPVGVNTDGTSVDSFIFLPLISNE